MTNIDKIKALMNSNNGYITRRQIDNNSIPSWFLSEYARTHDLYYISRGIYATKDWIRDEYLIFQYTYPKFIYSYTSALYLHHLTDILPNYLEVTGPKNYRPMKESRNDIFPHTDTKDNTYFLGITMVKTPFDNRVKCYDMEKTICDLIKNKTKIDREVFVKAMHKYIQRKDKNLNTLMKYASIMKIENKVRLIIEIIGGEK